MTENSSADINKHETSTERLWRKFTGIAIEEISILENEVNSLRTERQTLLDEIFHLENDKRSVLTSIADTMSDDLLEQVSEGAGENCTADKAMEESEGGREAL